MPTEMLDTAPIPLVHLARAVVPDQEKMMLTPLDLGLQTIEPYLSPADRAAVVDAVRGLPGEAAPSGAGQQPVCRLCLSPGLSRPVAVGRPPPAGPAVGGLVPAVHSGPGDVRVPPPDGDGAGAAPDPPPVRRHDQLRHALDCRPRAPPLALRLRRRVDAPRNHDRQPRRSRPARRRAQPHRRLRAARPGALFL